MLVLWTQNGLELGAVAPLTESQRQGAKLHFDQWRPFPGPLQAVWGVQWIGILQMSITPPTLDHVD